MLQKVRAEKRWKNDEKIWKRWKNRVICLVSMIASWVIVLKLSGKVHFLQFCADLSRKTKSIEAIYIYASERSFYALSGNGIAYYAMIYCFGDIRVWSQRTLLNFCWVSILFYILIANIPWRVAQTPVNQYVAQTPVNHIIFWKSVMRTFRCIYVNCFNRLRFLAEVSKKNKGCVWCLYFVFSSDMEESKAWLEYFTSLGDACFQNIMAHSYGK